MGIHNFFAARTDATVQLAKLFCRTVLEPSRDTFSNAASEFLPKPRISAALRPSRYLPGVALIRLSA